MARPMVTAGELASIRRDVESTFTHTYTRIPRLATADDLGTVGVDESQDAWGEQTVSLAAAQTSRPCKYREASTPVVTPNGLVNLNVPLLLVPSSDALAVGDQVSNVRDAYGTVLVVGPVPVEDISPKGLLAGGALHIEARLRQTQQG